MTTRAHRARRAAAHAGLAALLAAPALAAAAPVKDPEQLPIPTGDSSGGPVSGGTGDTLLRMGVGLAVVLAAIGAVWYILRRVRAARYPELDARGTNLIDVLSTTPLGPNRMLHVIRVGDEVVVLGATDQSLTPVARFSGDRAEELTQDLLAPDARGAFPPSTGSRRSDVRFRASAITPDATVLDRLRALTTRR